MAVESLLREMLTMQADGSVVVSELSLVVWVLAHSLARQCYTRRSLGRTPIFDTINTLHMYAFPVPTTRHVPKCYENDSRDHKTWHWGAYSERELLTMQSDASVVASELLVFVLVFARSLAHQYCIWRTPGRTPIFSTISKLHCSIVVSEIAAVVLVLARSFANAAHASRLVAHLHSTQSTHSTPYFYHSCFEELRRRLARLQIVAAESLQ